jgi:hypothetical protein
VYNFLDVVDTPYPYHVFFIIGNEFCERYAYYGMRSILIIFLTYFLGFSKVRLKILRIIKFIFLGFPKIIILTYEKIIQ